MKFCNDYYPKITEKTLYEKFYKSVNCLQYDLTILMNGLAHINDRSLRTRQTLYIIILSPDLHYEVIYKIFHDQKHH